jgi:hypothetical protein
MYTNGSTRPSGWPTHTYYFWSSTSTANSDYMTIVIYHNSQYRGDVCAIPSSQSSQRSLAFEVIGDVTP